VFPHESVPRNRDEFTARNAAELCGRRDKLKAHYSVSESGRDAHISLLTGRPTSRTQSLSASKTYTDRAK
jgi:hypothetical protein